MADDDKRIVKMSPERVLRAQQAMLEKSLNEDSTEAAEFTEEIVGWLNEAWAARGFSPEQAVFSLALACCNFRDHFPPGQGGTPFFDRVAAAARAYFDKNKNG